MSNLTRYQWLIIVFILFLGACNQSSVPHKKNQVQEQVQEQAQENEVPLEQVQIMAIESFPVQINVIARGRLPDSCTIIDEITEERNAQTLTLKIQTVRQTDKSCTQRGKTFEEIIPLDIVGLSAGVYQVKVNNMSESFELAVDNIIR